MIHLSSISPFLVPCSSCFAFFPSGILDPPSTASLLACSSPGGFTIVGVWNEFYGWSIWALFQALCCACSSCFRLFPFFFSLLLHPAGWLLSRSRGFMILGMWKTCIGDAFELYVGLFGSRSSCLIHSSVSLLCFSSFLQPAVRFVCLVGCHRGLEIVVNINDLHWVFHPNFFHLPWFPVAPASPSSSVFIAYVNRQGCLLR